MRLPFQLYENNDLTGLVKKSNLAYRYMIEPQEASKVITMIHSVNKGATVKSYLEKFPTLFLDSDDDFTWKIASPGKKNVPLVRCSLTSGGAAVSASDQVGRAGARFFLVFSEAYFTDVNIIVGERNEVYQIRILDDPKAIGSNWEYECELINSSDDVFVPYEELTAGKRFSKEFSIVEDTMSKKGGGVHYDFPFEMINQFTMLRMENTIPGNMIERPVKFDFVGLDSNGKQKIFTTWLDYATYQLEMQFQDEQAHMLMYSRSNKRDDGTYRSKGKSGNVIKQGAGIKQQMESSNTRYYNDFNIKRFTEMLLDLTVGKTLQGQREITISTGEWGMYQFSEALEDYASLYTPLTDSTRVSMQANDKLSYGGQFLEFRGPNGIKVNIIHDALKDDFARSKIAMPGSQGLAESYVYDILGMGTSDGRPNIQKVMKKNHGEIRGYVEGLRSPYSLDKPTHAMATSIDAWVEHRAFIGGAIVYDPTLTATYKPNVLS